MLSEYKDMLAKAKFYKKQVLQSFIKRGYFPSNEEVNAALDNIDMRSALLDTWLSAKGSLFDAKEINYMFECIYNDLQILYEVLNEILVSEYNKLKLEVEAKLIEMEQKAFELERRMDQEINSTALGNTIFFKATGWEAETNDDTTIVSLGPIDLIDGSRIAMFANVNNVEADSVYFQFNCIDGSNDSFFALPHNYNEDVYTVPGERKVNEYVTDLQENLLINGNIKITINNIDYDNDYKILGGKTLMKVTYKDDNTVSYESFASLNRPFHATRECYIEFYVYNKATLTYSFNAAPNHTSFSLNNDTVVFDDLVSKVFIDAPAGFICGFRVENGEIWASYVDAISRNDNTIEYSGDWNITTFKILEYVKAKKSIYNMFLILKSNSVNIVDYIDSVYIKEID